MASRYGDKNRWCRIQTAENERRTRKKRKNEPLTQNASDRHRKRRRKKNKNKNWDNIYPWVRGRREANHNNNKTKSRTDGNNDKKMRENAQWHGHDMWSVDGGRARATGEKIQPASNAAPMIIIITTTATAQNYIVASNLFIYFYFLLRRLLFYCCWAVGAEAVVVVVVVIWYLLSITSLVSLFIGGFRIQFSQQTTKWAGIHFVWTPKFECSSLSRTHTHTPTRSRIPARTSYDAVIILHQRIVSRLCYDFVLCVFVLQTLGGWSCWRCVPLTMQ